MQPNQQPDKVWISKEEYERLQQQAQQPAPPAASQPVVYGAGYQLADEPAKIRPVQAIIGTILAASLFLSLTVPIFKFISLPILVIMLVFAVMSFNDLRKAKQQPGTTTQFSANTAAIKNGGNGAGKYHTLLVILLATLAAPVIFIGGMIILLLTFVAAGGGKGS